MNKTRIGDSVEYKAISWLLDQQFEVFKNVGSNGPIDILVLDKSNNQIFRADIKKVVDKQRKHTRVFHPKLRDNQINLDIRLLYYNEKCNIFAWTTKEIYDSLGKSKVERTCPVYEVFNIKGTITQIAKHYNINPSSLREFHRRKPEVALQQAVHILSDRKKEVVVDGILYKDKKDLCKRNNISITTFQYWHYDKQMSAEDALIECIKRKG